MDAMPAFVTVKTASRVLWEVNKSKFIGQCFPVAKEEEITQRIQEIRREFWDASHHCYAYCIGLRGETARYSDDGEPGGTAGLPMIEVIKGTGATNLLCVVTRYFGGTLLGTGGLVRAYSKACALAVQGAGLVNMVPCDRIAFTVPYGLWSKFEQEILRQGATMEPVFLENVQCNVWVDARRSEALLAAVFDQSRGELKGTISGREYRQEDVYAKE